MAKSRARAGKRRRHRGFMAKWTAPNGMQVTCYDLPLDAIAADFFADPDGYWTYEGLAQAAGLAAYAGIAVGALKEPFGEHPEGAAVVTLNAESRPYVAIVECPIAYACVGEDAALKSSAA